MEINLNIKKYREKMGWSQAELSLKARLTPAAICQIEKNERLPSLTSIIKISNAFNVKIDDLLNMTPFIPRKFEFDAYLGEDLEIKITEGSYAIDTAIGHQCGPLLTEKSMCEMYNKTTKWRISMQEILEE